MNLRGKPAYADTAFRWLVIGAASLVLLILAFIAVSMTRRALPVLDHMGVIGFLTSKRWSPADQLYGALPFIWGTIFTAAIAVAIAVPISLGVALFVTQIAPRRWRTPIVYVMDLLAVVPSVVFGLFNISNRFRAPALLAGWAAGMIAGSWLAFSDGIKPVHTVVIGGDKYTIYTGLAALAFNIIVAVVVQLLMGKRGQETAALRQAG